MNMNIYFNLFDKVMAGHKVVLSVPTLITMIGLVKASGCGHLVKRTLRYLEDVLKANDIQVSDFVELFRCRKYEYRPLEVKRAGFYRWVKGDYRRWRIPRDRR